MLRKVKLYIAQSLDGFIATKDGGVEWLDNPDVEEQDINAYGYMDFYNTIDTTIMGYNTYKEILGFDVPFPYPDKKNYVISRNHRHEDDNPVEFVSGDLAKFVANLKLQTGSDIWLVGGGEINKVLLNADLIDEIIVTIMPVILGEGIPLFAEGTHMKRFKQVSCETFDGSLVQLVLTRR